jgi:hypothetical protein
MGQLITNPKSYTGEEMAEIFLRASFTGENAAALGLRVLYNIPVNTTLNFWKRNENILKTYAAGWTGGAASTKYQKTLSMAKIKAEQAFEATDYFGMVFEKITNSADANLQDLSGTDIEKAEVALFRDAIAEDTRVTMWVGDTAGTVSTYKMFDGFIKKASTYAGSKKFKLTSPTADNVVASFESALKAAPATLKAMKSTGKLAFFVTEDVYEAYQSALDKKDNTLAYSEMQMGRTVLNYHGIEVRSMGVGSHLKTSQSIIILTHKENLVFAVNTRDLPGAEVSLWYNPDEMENRQRACFLATAEILDEDIVVYASTTYSA